MRRLLLLLAACAAPGKARLAAQPETAVLTGPPAANLKVEGGTRFAPAGEPSPTLGGEAPGDGELERAVAPLLAKLGPPAFDARLSAVAADVAAFTELSPVPPVAAVELSLAHHGLVDPMPQWIVVETSAPDLAALLAVLAERLPSLPPGPWGRAGVARTSTAKGQRLVLGVSRVHLALEPVPRRLELQRSAELRGRLAGAEVFVADEAGRVQRLPVTYHGDQLRAQVTCQAPGRLDVEIHAGPVLAARFPLYCGVEPPRELALPVGTRSTAAPAEVEQQLFAELNAARRQVGLPELGRDERAASMARAHSESMRAREVVSHVSPAGGVPERAAAAGLGGLVVLENVTVAGSADEATAGLLLASGSRAARFSRQVTHAGVGVVAGPDGRLWITEVLVRVPPAIDPAAAAEQASQAFLAARERAGATRPVPDRELIVVAQEYAVRLARGDDPERVRQDAGADIEHIRGHHEGIVAVELVASHPAQIESERLLEAGVTHFGVGVAVAAHPQLGPGAFYVVVLMRRPARSK